jgi:photosystem II stability/assembly factor-like uncharacterized protein
MARKHPVWLALVAILLSLSCSLVGAAPTASPAALPTVSEPPAAGTATATAAATSVPTRAVTSAATDLPFSWEKIDAGADFPRNPATAFVAAPDDPDVMYLGTRNAGVYKSIDGGANWRPVRSGMGNTPVSRLMIDPSDPRTLYASTGSPLIGDGYLYKTTDGGVSWKILPTEGPGGSAVMDAVDPQRLYFLTQGGLKISIDGGGSWMTAKEFPDNIWEIYGHPEKTGVLFATPGPLGTDFYRSTDGGLTWSRLDLPERNLDPVLIARTPAGGEILLARAGWSDAKLYASEDDGGRWKVIATRCYNVAVDNRTPTTIFCGKDNGVSTYSPDAGISWNVFSHPGGKADYYGFSGDGARWILDTEGGIFLSPDSGKTWTAVKAGLGMIRAQLLLDPERTNVYAEDDRCNIFLRGDPGSAWKAVHPGTDYCGLSVGAGGDLYLSAGWGDIIHSSNGGGSWVSLAKPWDKIQRFDLAASPRDRGQILAITRWPEVGYFFSADGGGSWADIGAADRNLGSPFVFPPAPAHLVFSLGDSNASFSKDGGRSWSACGPGFPGSFSATADPFDPRVLYAVQRGVGFVSSADECRSWTSVNDRIGNLAINSLAADPGHRGRLFIGTDTGAFLSLDGGRTWDAIDAGLPSLPMVFSIAVDSHGRVLAATPEGFYQLRER